MDSPDCGGSMQIRNNKRNRKARNQKWFSRSTWPANKTWRLWKISFGVWRREKCDFGKHLRFDGNFSSWFSPWNFMSWYEDVLAASTIAWYPPSFWCVVCQKITFVSPFLRWFGRTVMPSLQREKFEIFLTRSNHSAWVENELRR